MAKRFIPFIGLAVVVALAFAATFGAVSLTPAYAGVAAPVDADLEGKGFQPQEDSKLKLEGGDREITLTWSLPTSTTTANKINKWQYTVDSADGDRSDWTDVEGGASTTEVVVSQYDGARLQNGVTYEFQVRAVNTDDSNDIISKSGTVEGMANKPPGAPKNVKMKAGEGSIILTWDPPSDTSGITEWQYRTRLNPWSDWMTVPDSKPDTNTYEIKELDKSKQYEAQVRSMAGNTPSATTGGADDDYEGVVAKAVAADGSEAVAVKPMAVIQRTFTSTSNKPGSDPTYKLILTAESDYTAGRDDIEIEMEDFGMPSSIDVDAISITIDTINTGEEKDTTGEPANVEVDGEDVTISLKPASEDDSRNVAVGDVVTIMFRSSSGITNPTEAGEYGWVVEWGDDSWNFGTASTEEGGLGELNITRRVSLSDNDGGRDKEITATAKGYEADATVTFFIDANKNRELDVDEHRLCSDVSDSNHIASCEFEVTRPPFEAAHNYVNAVSGQDYDQSGLYDKNSKDDDRGYFLEPSITASPAGGSPGETIQVQLVDFPAGPVTATLAGEPLGTFGTVGSQGDMNFQFTVPDNAREGKQDLKVEAGSGSDNDANVVLDISGPTVTPTPSDEILPNQRVNLVGGGFTSGSTIKTISIGGKEINERRINDGKDVDVDNGGNWSAAVDMPLSSATTSEGKRVIRVTDEDGRSGTVEITIPARKVTITPESGRVGTIAVVRGENFPSKNDEGNSLNVQIQYDAGEDRTTTVSAVPDASGKFEVELRIPTTASIPSTNTVQVSFDDTDDINVVTTVTHDVPEAIITLSATSGSPGTSVTLEGKGFKSFVPVTTVKAGSIDVTPSPKPSTDALGMMSFDIPIPGLDNGIQTIEVEVGQTKASVGFTVTPSTGDGGAVVEVAAAVANLGDNFVVAFHFNNTTKEWTFYDPAIADASDMTHFMSSQSYWIQVTETTEAILNGKTRNLTCLEGNCWNQIVW